MGLKEETFYYWYRRALEQKYGKEIQEPSDSGKVDDDIFEKQVKRLYSKIDRQEKKREGTISG